MSNEDVLTEFNALVNGDAADFPKRILALKKQAISSGLRQSKLRGLAWRLFLRVLPLDADMGWLAWSRSAKKWREEYEMLKDKFLVDPEKAEKSDLAVNNPLSTASSNPWSQYFQDSELCETIKLDLLRTHSEREFFADAGVQRQMLNVLFIWCKLHPEFSYRQGMNELLAPLLFTVSADSQHHKTIPSSDGGAASVLRALVDPAFVEHDAFCLFRCVMQLMAPYFAVRPLKTSAEQLKLRQIGGARMAAPSHNETPIVKKCNFLHHQVLQRVDPTLFKHLQEYSIIPQLYLLRWIRLLFAQEFHIDDVMRLWDGIFSLAKLAPLQSLVVEEKMTRRLSLSRLGELGDGFSFADFICIAMILYVRHQLLEGDQSFCLRRLKKYPPVEDVQVLIHSALQIRHSYESEGSSIHLPQQLFGRPKPPPPSVPFTQNRTNAHETAVLRSKAKVLKESVVKFFKKTPHRREAGKPISYHATRQAAAVNRHKTVYHEPKRPVVSVEALQAEVHELKGVMHVMGDHVDAIVRGLQKELVYACPSALTPKATSGEAKPGEEKENEEKKNGTLNPDIFLGSLAILKQVKDVLIGRLSHRNVLFDLSFLEKQNEIGPGVPHVEPTADAKPSVPTEEVVPSPEKEAPKSMFFARTEPQQEPTPDGVLPKSVCPPARAAPVAEATPSPAVAALSTPARAAPAVVSPRVSSKAMAELFGSAEVVSAKEPSDMFANKPSRPIGSTKLPRGKGLFGEESSFKDPLKKHMDKLDESASDLSEGALKRPSAKKKPVVEKITKTDPLFALLQ